MKYYLNLIVRHRNALIADRRRTLTFALPLIGAQLLSVSHGMVDMLVAGRIGRVELAAGGVGSAIWFVTNLACIGLMAGLSPTIARLIGRGRTAEVAVVFHQGLWLGAVLGCAAFSVMYMVGSNLDQWNFDPTIVPAMQAYLAAAAWSLPPAALLLAARNLCEASGRTRPVLFVQAIGVVVNLLGDLGLGLGWFGLPALGLAGIGWSTSLVSLTMCIALYLLIRGRGFRRYRLFERWHPPDARRLAALLGLSIPIAFTVLFEAGLFAATALQMGMLGPLEASAHAIAVGLTAFLYMLPLGLSLALTARVGRALGRENISAVQVRIANGLFIAVVMALVSASVLILLRQHLPALYTNDRDVQQLAARLLLMAALFQISDDLQAVLAGILRGLHDTRVPMLLSALAYWGVGFSTGYVCAHTLGWGPYGLWFGLIAGLTVSASLLGWRLSVVIDRLEVPPRAPIDHKA